MPAEHRDPESSSGTATLTIRLSTGHMAALRHLGEVFHATPERMAAAWVVHQIDRLTAGGAPDPGDGTAPSSFAPGG